MDDHRRFYTILKDLYQQISINIPELTLFIGSFVIYRLTLVHLHTYDALAYALSTNKGLEDAFLFLHPHHILFAPLAHAYLKIWQFAGWQGEILFPLQLLNAFFSSLALVVLYRILRVNLKKRTAYLTTMLVSVMYGYWLYSAEFEVYMLSLLFVLLTFRALISESAPSNREQLLTGLFLGLAVLSHQMNLLFILVLLALRLAKSGFRVRIRYNIIVLATMGILVLGAYIIAFKTLNLGSINQAWYWITSYIQSGGWGGFHVDTLSEAMLGTSKTILAPSDTLGLANGRAGILLLILGLFGAYFRKSDNVVFGAIIWIFSYGFFILWWEPSNPEFWISILPPLIFLLSNLTEASYLKYRNLTVIFMLLAIVSMGFYNWEFGISKLQDPMQDPRVRASMQLKECIRPGDKLIISDFGLYPWLSTYLGADIYPIDRAFLTQEFLTTSNLREHAIADIHAFIRGSLDQDARIFLLEEALNGTIITEKYQVDKSALLDEFSRYKLRETSCAVISPYRTSYGLQQLYELPNPQ